MFSKNMIKPAVQMILGKEITDEVVDLIFTEVSSVRVNPETDKSTTIYEIPSSELDSLVEQGDSELRPRRRFYEFPGEGHITLPAEKHGQKFSGVAFNIDNPEHLKYLEKCTDLFLAKLKKLQDFDTKVGQAVSVFVGVGILSGLGIPAVLNRIPFINLLTPLIGLSDEAALLATGSYTKARSDEYKEYAIALKLLVNNCAWALGFHTSETTPPDVVNRIMRNPVIQKMVKAASRVLTEQQMLNIFADVIEQDLLGLSADLREDMQKQNKYRSYMFDLYGTESHTISAFLRATKKYTQDSVDYVSIEVLNKQAIFSKRNQSESSKPESISEQKESESTQSGDLVARKKR